MTITDDTPEETRMTQRQYPELVAFRYDRVPGKLVGRGTRFGNPFSHKPDTAAEHSVATVEEAVREYRAWITAPEQADLLADARATLAGRVLKCYCRRHGKTGPPCHADVLAELVNPGLDPDATEA